MNPPLAPLHPLHIYELHKQDKLKGWYLKHIDNVTSFLSDGEFVKKSKIFIDIEYQDVVWTKLVDTSFSIIDKKNKVIY